MGLSRLSKATAGGEDAGVCTEAPSRLRDGRELAESGPHRETREGWFVLAAVWTIAAVYTAANLHYGFLWADAGSNAQMAERVLHGQVPYRDYIAVYTGGLDYLNALAFRLFGVNFFSLRIPLYLLFLAWVPSVYFIARRFVRPAAAGAVALLAVAWSVPNYPEPQPPWYNLFLATWGVLALFRYTETEKQRWLWVAGLAAGLSFLCQITGLYFVAAALLFFVFREISLSRGSPNRSDRGGVFYRVFASAGLLAFLAAVVDLIAARPTFADFFYFALPCAALVVFLLWETWRGPSDGSGPRFRRLVSMATPFLGGSLVPVAAFVGWIASRGALTMWFRGVFVLPMRRMQWAGMNPKSVVLVLGLLPFAVALIASCAKRRRLAAGMTVVTLCAILAACWRCRLVYGFAGYSLPLLVPLGTIAAMIWLGKTESLSPQGSQLVLLLVATEVVFSMVQFPLAAAQYFSYVAPLVVLAMAAMLVPRGRLSRFSIGALLAFYLVFAVWLRMPGYWATLHMATRPSVPPTFQTLDLPQGGGMRVTTAQARKYEAIVATVRAHARGPYIYAAVDSPQIYFLSGKRNPTGALWNFLDPDYLDPPLHYARVLEAIESHGVTVVVLHSGQMESGAVPPGLRAALVARFPESKIFGDYEVRWKR